MTYSRRSKRSVTSATNDLRKLEKNATLVRAYMSSPTRKSNQRGRKWFGWIMNFVTISVILTEIGGMYHLLRSIHPPAIVVYGGTTATAIVVGGAALYVASRSMGIGDPRGELGDESALTRVAEVIVSVSVLSAVTVLLGSIGGLGLTILAKLGGPDPKTADGELLRNRLLNWAHENREFMRNNGRGKLPLKP